MAENSTQIRSLAKALSVVDLLAVERREMSLTELSVRLTIPKSTLHGLLATLKDFGYVDQTVFDGKYKLGARLFELGGAVARNWDVRGIARKRMEKLAADFGESVRLGVLHGGSVLYIEVVEGNQALRYVVEVGSRMPLHCSAEGKVLLAFASRQEAKDIISRKGLGRMTNNTITSLERLEKELANVRKFKYAAEIQEAMPGVRAVAAPIFDHLGQVRYAIGIAGIKARMEGERISEAIRLAMSTAAHLSAELGYHSEADTEE